MTNKELLEIIKLAKENSVNVDTLRRILKTVEQDGEVSTKKVTQMKKLFQQGNINDDELLNVLEKAYQKRLSWNFFLVLNNHPLIKSYLNKMDFRKQEWAIILEFVSVLPVDIVIDSLYIKWLRFLYEQEYQIDELQFFHKVFKASINTPLIHSNWYFKYLLDKNKSLKNREEIMSIFSRNIFNMAQDTIILEMGAKAKKIIKCYELYGNQFADLYATIITCVVDIDVPKLQNDKEMDIYKILYTIMCHINDNLGINFINSSFYKLVTNKEKSPEKRLEFITIVGNKNLVLKDGLINTLWKIYEEKGKKFLIELTFAFLNNGIRTNILCKEFLLNEPDLNILKQARRVFRNNRVRKDAENLCILSDLKISEEKRELLFFLENKYQDDLELEEINEKRRIEEEQALLKAYQDFFNKKIGLEKLEQSLEKSEDLDISMVRVRIKKNDGRKI